MQSHSRNTTAADALHQAALNVKNTNNLPTDLRHSQLQPSGTSSTTTGMGTSGTSSGPVFHEQPRETMTSGTSSHLPRALDKDRDGRPDMLERDRNNDGIADRNQNLGTSSHLPRAVDKDQNGQLDALQRGHQSSMGTTPGTTGMGMGIGQSSHLPRALDKDRDGRPDMLERDRNNDGIADRNQNLGTSSHLPRAVDKDQNGQLDALQRGHQSSMGTTPGTTGMGMGMGMGMGQTKTTMTVESVARDAQAQIDAQVAEALAKSRQLNAQDQARLQSSIGSATASLQEQARQLKAQIDEERLRAEEHVRRAQQEKLSATAQRQAMEEKAIMEAAAARKIELEQKALRLQQEIEEITRQKTAEMMSEKPGNLQFVHQHQDTAVNAQLAGDIGHALDIQRSGRVTETTTGGDVQYHPVQVQTMQSNAAQQARAAEQTIQGPAVHHQHGGVLHAMKTFVTGESTTGTTSGTTTGMKQAPVQGTRAYDEQSQWANQSDKLASK